MIYGLYDDEEDEVLGWYNKKELLDLIQEYKPYYDRNNLNCTLSLFRRGRIDGINYKGKKYKMYILEDIPKEELEEVSNRGGKNNDI